MLTKLRQAREVYAERGIRFLTRESLEFALRRSPVSSRLSRWGYWKTMPTLYRWLYETDVSTYDAPLDPFKIEYVDPSRITTITGRQHPTWTTIKDDFGTVLDGDWDQPNHNNLSIDSSESEVAASFHLAVADSFSDSILHRSLERHFRDGVPWEETELVRKVRWMLAEGDHVWNGCHSERDVRRRCEYLDRLYERIESSGYTTQAALLDRDSSDTHCLDLIANEILVDVGRDGELLFVDGRHRLSIAKILGLERVPVGFVVRHPRWMERREEAWKHGGSMDHPDLRDLERGFSLSTRLLC